VAQGDPSKAVDIVSLYDIIVKNFCFLFLSDFALSEFEALTGEVVDLSYPLKRSSKYDFSARALLCSVS
jgi:hypothetical protein